MSFDVGRGEAVAVIGRNGAGKSTLLKILSRITEPSAGRIELHGRVGSLLEVGTGFHPELTGRENIFLNGAILGMSRREVTRQFDSIVDFSQIERFLDTPVKRYSSGMYVRLAFAVAAHLTTEILVVDEVLAVGDVQFQHKCLGKMGDVSRQEGRTVLFVSHNMSAVASLCPRSVYLEGGEVAFDGDTAGAVSHYFASLSRGAEMGSGSFDLTQVARTEKIRQRMLRSVEIRDHDGKVTGLVAMGRELTVAVEVEGLTLPRHMVAVRIVTEGDVGVITLNTVMRPVDIHRPDVPQQEILLHIPRLPLVKGRYWVELAVGDMVTKKRLDHVERAASFDVMDADVYGSGVEVPSTGPYAGVVFVDAGWEVWGNGLLAGESP